MPQIDCTKKFVNDRPVLIMNTFVLSNLYLLLTINEVCQESWKQSGTNVASFSCQILAVPTQENTSSMRNLSSSLSPISSLKVRSIRGVLDLKVLGPGL